MFRPRNFLLGGIAKNPALPGFEVASSINFQISLMAVVAVEAKGREVAPPFLLLRYRAICSLSFFPLNFIHYLK